MSKGPNMPSPFPGMDPYLEDPGLWPDVHHGLISEMQAALNQQLRPNYYVRVEERVYISDDDDPGRRVLVPDLRVAESRVRKGPAHGASAGKIQVAEPVIVTTLIEDEIHEPRLNVIDRADRSVVCVIEILSPSNKVSRARGRANYLAKRFEVMTSPSHFVEIDLLRAGKGIEPKEGRPPGDYYLHVSRVQDRPKGRVWPLRLPEPLPPLPIPLKPEHGESQLDLQKILETAYDRGAYDMTIDYRAEPKPPLPKEYADWADQLLRSKGLR